jgi:protein-disulfide isomerase
MHKFALKAAEATHCSQEQGKFWEIHDGMMSDQKKLGELNSYAESIDLDIAQFEGCLNTNKYADEVQKDIRLARKLGVSGTPSFVLARTDPKDPTKVKGISLIRGAQPFAAFKRLIDQALTEAQK